MKLAPKLTPKEMDTVTLTPKEMVDTVTNGIDIILKECEGEMPDSWLLLQPTVEPDGSVTGWVTFDGPEDRTGTTCLLFAGSCTREDVEKEIARYAREHGVE